MDTITAVLLKGMGKTTFAKPQANNNDRTVCLSYGVLYTWGPID